MTPNTDALDGDSPNDAYNDNAYPYQFQDNKNNKNNITPNTDYPDGDAPNTDDDDDTDSTDSLI